MSPPNLPVILERIEEVITIIWTRFVREKEFVIVWERRSIGAIFWIVIRRRHIGQEIPCITLGNQK